MAGGTTAASTDPEQIAEWAEKFPDANVGVVCRLNGLLIVDDDEGIVERSGIPVNTRVVESSPGHRQYYFWHTGASAEVGNIGQRGGFSLRAHNYYGLAAGSLHPQGHHYRLLVAAPIQPIPGALLNYLQRASETANSRRLAQRDFPVWGPLERKLGEGEGRNDDMTRLAGIIQNCAAVSDEEFLELLRQQCELRHDPPYPESRLAELIERARKWKCTGTTDWADLFETAEYWIGVRPRSMSLEELDEQIKSAKSLEELVQGMLPIRSVNIIGGDSGLGKSPLLCQLAVCVAGGVPFLGHAVRQSRVLFVDYENDYALSGMLHSVAKAVNAGAEFQGNLFILQRPERDEVIKEIGRLRAGLVIVDSLRGFDSLAESKPENTGKLISSLQDVDTCWLLIHHLRKQKSDLPRPDLNDESIPLLTWLENLSGHRSLVNQTFSRLGVDRSGRKSAELVLRGYFKGKGEFGPLHLERVYDETGEPIGFSRLAGTGLLSLNQKVDLQKVQALGRPVTFAELTETLGAKSSASRLLTACRSAGLVRDLGTGRKDRRYEFRVPEGVGNSRED